MRWHDRDLHATARAIAAIQLPNGAIPWGPDRHVDPWNHVEAAMGLDCGREHAAARRAYRWLASTQRDDGAWPAAVLNGDVFDETLDANFVAYIACGVWHHYLFTQEIALLQELWPTVATATDFVVRLQASDGSINWARDARGNIWEGALLTSSACIYLSIRCALAIGAEIGESKPEWELALGGLGAAVRRGPGGFEPKERYSMDWYYPVLGGAVAGEVAVAALREGWDEFVIEGRGCLCVADRPWATTGETSELALACFAAGLDDEARTLFGWVQGLRASDGLYWTGINLPDDVFWPVERTTWSAASVLLAADALHAGPTASLFDGTSLGALPEWPGSVVDPI